MPIITVESPFYDRLLHRPCKNVKNFDDPQILMLTQEMTRIASSPGAAGVAAPQLGKSFKIFALQTDKKYPVLLFFNPKIVSSSEETYEVQEGCLSVPGKVCKVIRHKEVTLVWQDFLGAKVDPTGRKYEFTFTGFAAQAVQHELDHLNSTLIVDIAEEIYDSEQIEKAYNEAMVQKQKEIEVQQKA